MEVRLASVAAPDRPVNEDHAFAYGDLIGVLDGVTQDTELDNGCRHGPTWYVRGLAAHLAQAHTAEPQATLAQLLAVAIDAVRGDHGGSCDLNNPSTPASTACILRINGENLDYLVLGDSPLVLDCGGGRADVITDERFAQTIARIRRATSVSGAAGPADPRVELHTPEKYRYTNRPGGYWIAAADPQAAFEAVAGTVPMRGPGRVRRAALLTDGASRAVEKFGLTDWPGLLDVLTFQGPAELIRQVRKAEFTAYAQPRFKRHDDATAALCLFEEE